MSGFELVKEVQRLPAGTLCPADKPVLMELAQCSKGNRTQCWPSQAFLTSVAAGARGGTGGRSVREALRHLEIHGWMNSDQRQRLSNVYTLTVDTGTPCTAPTRRACLKSVAGLSMREARLKILTWHPGAYEQTSTPMGIPKRRKRLKRSSTDLPRKESLNKQGNVAPECQVEQGKQVIGFKFQRCADDENGHAYRRSCRQCVDREGVHP